MIDGRVGPDHDSDHHGKGKIIDNVSSENEQGEYGEKSRSGSDDSTAEGLIDTGVEDFGELGSSHDFQVVANTVEDDDRVVEGVSDDGQDGGDNRKVHFPRCEGE